MSYFVGASVLHGVPQRDNFLHNNPDKKLLGFHPHSEVTSHTVQMYNDQSTNKELVGAFIQGQRSGTFTPLGLDYYQNYYLSVTTLVNHLWIIITSVPPLPTAVLVPL